MDPIEQKFARIGARVNVGVMPRLASGRGENPPVRVDIRRTRAGRPVQTTQIYEGTNQIQRMVIAKRLLG